MKKTKNPQTNRVIVVSHGLRKQIMETLNVTYPTIRSALKFKSNTLNAQLIRLYALTHGGKMMISDRGMLWEA